VREPKQSEQGEPLAFSAAGPIRAPGFSDAHAGGWPLEESLESFRPAVLLSRLGQSKACWLET
jgi:hypothetical protein